MSTKRLWLSKVTLQPRGCCTELLTTVAFTGSSYNASPDTGRLIPVTESVGILVLIFLFPPIKDG